MGKHWTPGQPINTEYIEAYNAIWNFRAKNRSPDIEQRLLTDTSLAPAFWLHQTFAHIVPDFDQAIIDGEVALSVVNAKMPVSGLGLYQPAGPLTDYSVKESGNKTTLYPKSWSIDNSPGTQGFSRVLAREDAAHAGFPDIYAELQDNGITLSLANIELARKTQAFANLRRQYNMHEDYVIDLLMDGITIPDQAWKQPILLFD